MSVLQFLNLVVLTIEVIFFYIPSIWIVFAIVFFEGLLGGSAYVNTFYRMTNELPQSRKKFALGAASISDSIGIAIAGVVAFPVHNAICMLPVPDWFQ